MSTNPVSQSQPPTLESEQRAHEPSMEEILASIRRIIADDDALPLMRRPSLVPREPPAALAEPERRLDAARHGSMAPVHLVPVPDGASTEQAHSEPAATRYASSGEPGEEYPARDSVGDDYQRRASLRDQAATEEEDAAPITPAETRGHDSVALPATDRHAGEQARLISPATDASVASSFQSLAASMFLRDSDMLARTTREMLRPMLKQWLDDNLPVMVERLVRAEIERVARGGR